MIILNTGKKEYQLRLTTKGCISIESRIKKNPLNVFMEASENKVPMISDLMVILHECINGANHGIKLEDVYDIYDEYCANGGDFMSLIELLVEAFKESGFIPKNEEELKN